MGILDPSTSAARVSSVVYSATNTMPGYGGTSYWQYRTSATRTYYIDFASAGIIDLGLFFRHTHKAAGANVSITMQMVVALDFGGTVGIKNGQTLWSGTLPYDARFAFVPERGNAAGTEGTTTQKVIEIPELRQPIQKLALILTPGTVAAPVTPDEGDLWIGRIARY